MSGTPEDSVHAFANQLRQYATHFVSADWDYTRDLRGMTAIRYDWPEDTLRGRFRSARGWLFRKTPKWVRDVRGPGRFRMALHVLHRESHLPDGQLDNGCIIVQWEETGEYLQYVQPSVGAMLADWMDADPESEHAQRIAAEMKRINDGYGQRVASEEEDEAA